MFFANFVPIFLFAVIGTAVSTFVIAGILNLIVDKVRVCEE